MRLISSQTLVSTNRNRIVCDIFQQNFKEKLKVFTKIYRKQFCLICAETSVELIGKMSTIDYLNLKTIPTMNRACFLAIKGKTGWTRKAKPRTVFGLTKNSQSIWWNTFVIASSTAQSLSCKIATLRNCACKMIAFRQTVHEEFKIFKFANSERNEFWRIMTAMHQLIMSYYRTARPRKGGYF